MRCDKIRDLLLTDYMDNELDRNTANAVKKHLLICPACLKLDQKLRAQRSIMTSSEKNINHEKIWENIRLQITSEKSAEIIYGLGVLDRMKEAFFNTRPAFRFATALTAITCLIIAAGVFIGAQTYYRQESDDILSVYTLNGQSVDLLNNLGTNIEDYFL